MKNDANFLMDIDRKPKNLNRFAEQLADRMAFVSVFMPFRFYQIEIYETSKGYHLYLWSEGETPSAVQQVLIQMALGSDYRREIFNYKRVWSKKIPPRWNLLFCSKYDDNGKIVSREEKTNNAIRLEEEIMALYMVKIGSGEEET